MRLENLIILILVTLAIASVNLVLLCRLWRDGRRRRRAIRQKLDTLKPSVRLRPYSRED